jgi:hypothetical protein
MLTKTKLALAAIAMFGAASAAQAADKEEGVRQAPEGPTITSPAPRAMEPKANIQTEGRGANPIIDGKNPAVERVERRDNTEDDRTPNSKDR